MGNRRPPFTFFTCFKSYSRIVVCVDNTWSANALTIKFPPPPPAPPPFFGTRPANGLLTVTGVRSLLLLARIYTYAKKISVAIKYPTNANRAIRTALASNISILLASNITPTVIIICCIDGGVSIASYTFPSSSSRPSFDTLDLSEDLSDVFLMEVEMESSSSSFSSDSSSESESSYSSLYSSSLSYSDSLSSSLSYSSSSESETSPPRTRS